jgi:tetratricopeptide (TPR) repeat protein
MNGSIDETIHFGQAFQIGGSTMYRIQLNVCLAMAIGVVTGAACASGIRHPQSYSTGNAVTGGAEQSSTRSTRPFGFEVAGIAERNVHKADAPADKPKATAPVVETPAKAKRKLSTQEATAEATKLLQKNDVAGAIGIYEDALRDNGDDSFVLLMLSQLHSSLAPNHRPKPVYTRYLKAADYLRRAFESNRALETNPFVRQMTGSVFYNEALALAQDGKADQALKRLAEAVDHEFRDLALMDRDADLKSVRALDADTGFRTKLEATLRAQAP